MADITVTVIDIHVSLTFKFSAYFPMQQILMSVVPIIIRVLKPPTAATLMAVMSVSAGQDMMRCRMRKDLVAQVSRYCVHVCARVALLCSNDNVSLIGSLLRCSVIQSLSALRSNRNRIY